ncbi:hypothetical protein B0H14DRAFT_2566747 [Mycena olivaceomarginata]|nr:hypothetical protein B0H14DRAFT_2566747 [Mycena olivaceomarginata]
MCAMRKRKIQRRNRHPTNKSVDRRDGIRRQQACVRAEGENLREGRKELQGRKTVPIRNAWVQCSSVQMSAQQALPACVPGGQSGSSPRPTGTQKAGRAAAVPNGLVDLVCAGMAASDAAADERRGATSSPSYEQVDESPMLGWGTWRTTDEASQRPRACCPAMAVEMLGHRSLGGDTWDETSSSTSGRHRTDTTDLWTRTGAKVQSRGLDVQVYGTTLDPDEIATLRHHLLGTSLMRHAHNPSQASGN